MKKRIHQKKTPLLNTSRELVTRRRDAKKGFKERRKYEKFGKELSEARDVFCATPESS